MSTQPSPSVRTDETDTSPCSIVVGVDHRGRSVSAVVWAVEEADRAGGSLRLVSAATHEPADGSPAAQHDVVALARRLTVRNLKHRDVVGSPVDVLLEAAADADLLVVGCRSLRPTQRLVLGSTSRALATLSPVPVVIVPEAWMQPSMAAAPVVAGIGPAAGDDEVLRFALLRARRDRVPLVVVSAFEAPYLSTWSPADVKRTQADHDAALHARLVPWRETNPGLEIAGTAVMGPADRAIVDASRIAQLTVVGRGSTVRGVLEGAATPVAVVPVASR